MQFGYCDLGDLKKLQEKLNKVQQADMDAFLNICAKELAARLLREVIRKTPVGQYEHRTGGTLRRGWTAQTQEEAAQGAGSLKVAAFLDKLDVTHTGDSYQIEIKNPVEYASYVEYGHRTVNHKGWVSGRFMLTISEQHIQEIAPNLLARKLKKFLKGYFT